MDGRAAKKQRTEPRPRCSAAPLRHCRPHAVALSAFSSCTRPTFLAHLHPPLNVAGSRASLMSRLSGTWPVSPSTAPSASGNMRELPRPFCPQYLATMPKPVCTHRPTARSLTTPPPASPAASTFPRLHTPPPPTSASTHRRRRPPRAGACSTCGTGGWWWFDAREAGARCGLPLVSLRSPSHHPSRCPSRRLSRRTEQPPEHPHRATTTSRRPSRPLSRRLSRRTEPPHRVAAPSCRTAEGRCGRPPASLRTPNHHPSRRPSRRLGRRTAAALSRRTEPPPELPPEPPHREPDHSRRPSRGAGAVSRPSPSYINCFRCAYSVSNRASGSLGARALARCVHTLRVCVSGREEEHVASPNNKYKSYAPSTRP